MLSISIKKAPDHALILRVVLLGFTLEELDALLAQCERYLHALLTKCEIPGRQQEIRYHPRIADGFIAVFDFRGHRYAFLCAGNQRQ